jgi:hypothetical protein
MNLTPPYPNALDSVNCNIHGILAFRKAEGGETSKKILFPSEILVFNLIPLLTTHTRKPHITQIFGYSKYYKSCIVSNNTHVPMYYYFHYNDGTPECEIHSWKQD